MISLTAIPASRIRFEWRWIEPLLMRAMQKVRRKQFDTHVVLHRLLHSEATAYEVSGDQGSGVVVLSVHSDGWLQPEFMAGKVDLPPKQFRAFFNAMIDQFEACAKAQGCTEIRVFGRLTGSGILTGFELTEMNGEPMLVRKVGHA